MIRIRSLYLAKLIHKMNIASFRACKIDKTSYAGPGCALSRVTMDRYSYAGDNTHITDAEIGAFCSIGMNCSIGGGIHPTDTVSTSPVFLKGRNILKTNFADIPYSPSIRVTIGNDVWIGNNAFIKAGVTIGTGAVIGAHAVVTHDVEPYSVVAGVPAVQIRKRFDAETINALLRSKWWLLSEAQLNQYGEFFRSPAEFISAFEGKV